MGSFSDDDDNEAGGRRSFNDDRSGSGRGRGGGRGGRGGRGHFNDDERGDRGDRRGGDFQDGDRDDGGRFHGEGRRGRGGRGGGRGRDNRRGSDDEGQQRGKWGSDDYDNDGDGGRDRPFDGEERRGRGGRGGGRGRGGRRGSDENDRDNGGWGKDEDAKDGDMGEDGEPEKKPITYIPTDRTEEELFSETGIQKGVNFNDYESIQVKVSGENAPPPISSFEAAQLRSLLISNLKKCHYEKPTPIQKYSIPIIMAGRDIMATAQTGSGKTAAYLVPIVNSLLANSDSASPGSCVSPEAVIICPTRELAIQIEENARRITSQSSLKVVLLYGGVQPRYQATKLSRGCNILIATPGRLNDFMEKGYLKFDAIQFVVLDEADRMLDMGFKSDVEKVMNHESMSPQKSRQALMFSATFSAEIQKLAAQYLRADYLFVTVGIVGGACKDVEQNFLQTDRKEKKSKLIDLLEAEADLNGTLLFVDQKRIADYLATFLCEKGFKTTSIHGDRVQAQREEALRDFKTKRMQLLVATNVAARGLDITGVTHVINYDLPKEIDEYVHRIGRTGRLGNRGKSTSFYDKETDEAMASNLARILKQAGQPIPDFIQADASDGASGGDFESGGGFGGEDFRNDAADDWDA